MTTTLINDPFAVEAMDFLEWFFGARAKWNFIDSILMSQRVGQAFMNTLRMFDQDSYVRIAGSSVDPFYRDEKIPEAIDKITSK